LTIFEQFIVAQIKSQSAQLSLLPASEYGYPEDRPLMRRMPLATVTEVRSAEFPATNNPWVPVAGEERSVPAASQAPYVHIEADGGVFMMAGIRIEKHRRFLDFLFSTSQPLRVAGGVGQGFMFRRREAAKVVEGDASKGLLIDKLVLELQGIKVRYIPPGHTTTDGVGHVQPLCIDYDSKFVPGNAFGLMNVDASLRSKGFDPSTFEGYSFIAISRTYLDRFLLVMTMRYHASLPTIFKMEPETAGLARYAISNEFLNGAPLNEILDKIGAASSGGARDRVVRTLKSPRERKLLLELGIRIELKGRMNRVYYSKEENKTRSINSFGVGWNKHEAIADGRWKEGTGKQGRLGL
jgi:hypothetical protein